MRARPLILKLALLAATVLAGLAVRFAPLGLPRFASKYGGSMLWALAIYWVVSAVLPGRRIPTVALWAGSLATAVEFFKLYNPPAVDAFRRTLPGVLLLGRIFSLWDILAYWLGILLGVLLDRRIRPEKTCQPELLP